MIRSTRLALDMATSCDTGREHKPRQIRRSGPSCYITWNHFFCDVDDTFAVLRRIAKAKLARGRGERYQQAATAQRGIL
jgi:hypothetical protein